MQVSPKNDFPNWLQDESGSGKIEFRIAISIHRELDTGLYRFITTFLGLKESGTELELELAQQWTKKGTKSFLRLGTGRTDITDQFQIAEIFKKLRSSKCLIFHNSTQQGDRLLFGRRFSRMFGGLSGEEAAKLKKANESIARLLKRTAQRHQKAIIDLLGRLEEKYDVTLSPPSFDFEDIPFSISLGEKGATVSLDDLGSGTQNRTLILLSLLRARKYRETASESDRITPSLLIEEPESFLHPSAQAEFGKLLQEISSEFDVQVITTTHSPYMLSLQNPSSNILLRRDVQRHRLLETQRVPTGTDNWMEPFGLALGIENSVFSSWRDVLFKGGNKIILVEGEIDKAYFEMLRDTTHGQHSLISCGEIFPYGGTGFFENTVLVKFIVSRFSRFVITFDLDREARVSKCLSSLGLKKNSHYIAVGVDTPGKRDVEGLLPDSVRTSVYARLPNLVALATSSEKDRDNARQQLKRELLKEFQNCCKPTEEYFGEFYKLVRIINKILQ